MDAFRSATVSRFEAAMMERCKVLAPRRCGALRGDLLRVAVQAAIARAARHGFTFTGPVRLFVELSMLLGSGFDHDRQYAFARECLVGDSTQMQRAEALHARAIATLRSIQGAGERHADTDLEQLRELVTTVPTPGREGLEATALAMMARMQPHKYAHVAEPALRSLIAVAEAEAAWHGVSAPQDVLLIVALMYAFGQGCLEDPLYPWIADGLDRERGAGPARQAERLREQTLAWLAHVLGDREQDA